MRFCGSNIKLFLQSLVFLLFVSDVGRVFFIDMLCSGYIILYSKLVHLESKNSELMLSMFLF